MRDDGSPDDAVQISRRVIIPPPPGVEVTNTREVGILLNPDEDNPGKFTASITGLSEGEREAVRALLKLREADPAGAREMEAKIPDLVRLVDGARKDAAALIYRLRHFPAGAAMAAWTAAKTLSGPDPHKILHEVARWALAKFTDTDDALAGDARENAELRDPYVRTLHEHVVNALKAAGVGVGGHPETDDDAAQLRGEPGREILIQDARFADYLEGLGEEGAANAESVRKSGRERAEMFNHPQLERDPDGEVYENRGELWGLWVDVGPSDRPGFLFLRYLAVVVWADVVRPALAERQRREQLALSRVGAYQSSIFDVIVRGSLAPAATVEASGTDRLSPIAGAAPRILDSTGRPVGWFHGGTVAGLRQAEGALRTIRSPAGITLLCMGAETIARQVALGAQSAIVTRHPGPTEFARSLGVKTGDLKDLLNACKDYRADAIDGLFTFGFVSPSPGQPAETILTWNAALFAGESLLTPTPDPNNLPTFGPRLQRRGLFAWLLVHWHMSRGSRDLAERGAAGLPLDTIRNDAGIPRARTWHGLLDVLLGERNQGPYLLKGDSPDTFLLADTRRHNFLVEQGQRRARKSAGGKIRAAKARRQDGKFATGKGFKGRKR